MQGQTLEQLFAGRNIDLGALHERMQTLMTAEGLDYNRRTHTYNSRLAQELGKWALTRKNGLKLHNALYRTYFVDGRNLADLEELVKQADAAGLPANEARSVLVERQYRQAVDDDWAYANRLGIQGVPTFVMKSTCIVGAQPYETLRDFALAQGAKPRREKETPP